jgi:hypothetical protein
MLPHISCHLCRWMAREDKEDESIATMLYSYSPVEEAAAVRLKWMLVTALLAGGILIHALWDPERTVDPTSDMNQVSKPLAEEAEQAIQSIRSIRVGSDSPPWVLMHALLAFGPDLEMVDAKTKKPMRILNWMCGPGSAGFFHLILDNSGENHGVPDRVQSRSECHPDQWLCIMSAHPVPLTQELFSMEGISRLIIVLRLSSDRVSPGARRHARADPVGLWNRVRAEEAVRPKKGRWRRHRLDGRRAHSNEPRVCFSPAVEVSLPAGVPTSEVSRDPFLPDKQTHAKKIRKAQNSWQAFARISH